MKKILIGLGLILSLGLVGCTESSNDDINVMSVNEAEEVVKSEYASRLERIMENTIFNNEYISLDDEDRAKKEDEYDKKYVDCEVVDEQFYGGERDRYKDYTEGLSTFRTEDEEINKLHDKLIEVSLDVYNMLNEKIELAIEYDGLMTKEDDATESDFNRMDEIDSRDDILADLIDNQIEHIENIGVEIFTVLGVK